ncbi:F0F1 ATP synthase subunit A [Mycoplasma marinum]|uniref:F0F1 ATP synthase subunit A n=1 Tax=Mycoplasma marinum TaxID=1937190 RepID=A0A4R0XU29_9MOLU|nr:F0F1 ATP synthase subunit A [Mycoplasma marinum]TCG12038.1 F0F1 ATP synthase subunit A [Mycoplasma marinum]
MDKIAKNIGKWWQPQLVSLILVTIILIVIAIIIYSKVKKTQTNKAPKGVAFVAEQYVMGVDNLFKSVTGENKLQPVAPYIFTLLTFLMVGNLFGLIGLEPPTTSYSVPLTLGMVTWIGIYVVGIMYQKHRFFKKFLNPLEIIGQFTPLISISFRLFGNMIGGSTIMFLVYHLTGAMWSHIPYLGEVNLLGSLIAPPLHFYFDVFDGIIQGFVFTLLTTVYWSLETVENDEQRPVVKDEKVIAFAKQKGKLKTQTN